MAVVAINFEDARKRTTWFRVDLDGSRAHHRAALEALSAGRMFEADVSETLGRILEPGDVFVDVGANMGLLTLLAGAMVGASGRVIAFEPGENVLAELRAEVELNGFSNVTIVPKAVSDRAGMVRFFLNNDDSGGNALWDPAKHPLNRTPAREVEVEAVRLDAELRTLLGGVTPKVVKIDTEGAEFLVLRGAEELLSPAKIPFVICEFHPTGLSELGCDEGEMRRYMRERGYETYVLSKRNLLPLNIPPGVGMWTKFVVNLMFTTREMIEKHWGRVEFAEPY